MIPLTLHGLCHIAWCSYRLHIQQMCTSECVACTKGSWQTCKCECRERPGEGGEVRLQLLSAYRASQVHKHSGPHVCCLPLLENCIQ